MARTITIDPVTRIEGHARVEVDIDDDNNVTSSAFKVLDFRGWETFLQGMQVELMPTITSRICGTCSASHHLVSALTVDKVFGVTPPRSAQLLRCVLNLAHYIHSHGVHFFALAAPDLLLEMDANPKERNIVGLVKAMPDVAKKALRLRTIGQRITEVIGGRGTHPVSFVAGGVASPLGVERRELLERLAGEAVPLALELYQVARDAVLANPDLVESLPLETHYLGLVNEGNLDLMRGMLRLRAPDGSQLEFAEDDWKKYLFEETDPRSYAKFVFCNTGNGDAVAYRVGPLARLNCCDQIDTPMANEEMQAFRETGGFPCHQTVMYHYARLIELLYSVEKLAELVKDEDLYSDNVRTAPQGTPHSATAIVEAPRGVLIHDYEVDSNGLLTRANLLVATQQNTAAINATVGMSAQQYLDQPDDLLLNAIEFGIRCYDPCLSCATHRLGEMKLDVLIRQRGETVRRARR